MNILRIKLELLFWGGVDWWRRVCIYVYFLETIVLASIKSFLHRVTLTFRSQDIQIAKIKLSNFPSLCILPTHDIL